MRASILLVIIASAGHEQAINRTNATTVGQISFRSIA
jgi:hypothetical protein